MDALTCWCCDRLVASEACIYQTRNRTVAPEPKENLFCRTGNILLTIFAACWVLSLLGLRISAVGLVGYMMVFLIQAAQSFHF
jgi:hypothetical protein